MADTLKTFIGELGFNRHCARMFFKNAAITSCLVMGNAKVAEFGLFRGYSCTISLL
jgi:hypothetical protein